MINTAEFQRNINLIVIFVILFEFITNPPASTSTTTTNKSTTPTCTDFNCSSLF